MSSNNSWVAGKKPTEKIESTAAYPAHGPETVITYTSIKKIGNGSFGDVYQAKLCSTGEWVAIKKVLQDKRFKNRELQIIRRLDHCNIVKLKYYFYTNGEKKDEVYLNLILEYIPETVYRIGRHYNRCRQPTPMLYIKLYMYQVFRSLAYIHSYNICHRDIKPHNLLVDHDTGVLKLCDFGSSKELVPGEPNVSYICSRYYRAPELIFGATDYTTQIDVWSAGCVLAELLMGTPIFPGDSGVDQLVEIIKILGTPSKTQILEMNRNYLDFKFPQIHPHGWSKVFRPNTPKDAMDLVSKLLEYTPSMRIRAVQALVHPFFDELRDPEVRMPNNHDLPLLFNFSEWELGIDPSLKSKLVPPHVKKSSEPTATPKSSSSSNSDLSSTTVPAGVSTGPTTGTGLAGSTGVTPGSATAVAAAAATGVTASTTGSGSASVANTTASSTSVVTSTSPQDVNASGTGGGNGDGSLCNPIVAKASTSNA